ncbi:MAG: pre-toxin TG domain-containing protein [Planctomycetota bacterium]|nr:pre-toxin TG domain-containing protein [Planctomycetota bacterium]
MPFPYWFPRGTANKGLDMIPFVGLGKGVIEVIYGDDIITDLETKNE